MSLSHGANLSTEVSLGVKSGVLASCTYHIMCKDSLGLRSREQMQHCYSCWKNFGETHIVWFEKDAKGIESRGNVVIYILDGEMEYSIVSSS